MWQFPQQKSFDPAAHSGVSSVFVTCPSNKKHFFTLFLGCVYCEPLTFSSTTTRFFFLSDKPFSEGCGTELVCKESHWFWTFKKPGSGRQYIFSQGFLFSIVLLNSKGLSRFRTSLPAAQPSILGRIWDTMNYEISKSGPKVLNQISIWCPLNSSLLPGDAS